MINYIIQVLLFQTLFLAVYDLFLKKETFFQWNRFYLILTSILAYIIPFIKINSIGNYVHEEFIIPEIFINPETIFINEVVINEQTSVFTLENLYFLGLAVMSVLFLWKLIQIIRKISQNKVINKIDYRLVILKKGNQAFSFFKYIFLGETIYNKEYQEVLKHELIHVKQKHTLDLLFFEIQKIVFWFNPFSYLFQNRISTLHEYIADAKTIKTVNKTSFFESLLNQTFNVEKITFVNNYYKQSLLKKRIIMATKNKSKQIIKMKYLLVLPLLFMMLVITSCVKKENIKEVTEIEKVKEYSKIEKAPIYPGCEEFTNYEDIKKCYNKKINKHIQENFNVDLANNLDLPVGKKRIVIQYVIGKDGFVKDIKSRAPHKKLEEEAIRIIKLLPQMQAGEIDGKKVAVSYTVPINFMVED